jgi:hypothetical protein
VRSLRQPLSLEEPEVSADRHGGNLELALQVCDRFFAPGAQQFCDGSPAAFW